MSKKVIAAIDIGAHAIRMKIGEINTSGEFKELESVRKISVLGHDTFTQGKIEPESVNKLCEILMLFKHSFESYGVERYEAVATSAIREALNRDYILDQIKLKTGLSIRVVDNSEEQYLTHRAVQYHLANYKQIIKEGAVIVVAGAGSIQITTFKDSKLVSAQNIKLGALRINEVFGEFADSAINYTKLVDEYIMINFEEVDFFSSDQVYKHFVAIGGEIAIVSHMVENVFGEDIQELSKKKFSKLLKQVMNMTNSEIEEAFKIKRERADIILPSMLLFQKFLERVESNSILTPKISLTDGIIRKINDDLHKVSFSHENMEIVLMDARSVARKFYFNEVHSEKVNEYCQIIFDRTKKMHGLDEERILLHVASILHDIGKAISLDNHEVMSFQLINSIELLGLSKEHMEKIALICSFHGMSKPNESDHMFAAQSRKDKAQTAKLIAIMRLADALDRSHKGKITVESVRLKNNQLIIQGIAKVNIDTTLEEWTFKKKSDFFIEVFGITPILKIKREFV